MEVVQFKQQKLKNV